MTAETTLKSFRKVLQSKLAEVRIGTANREALSIESSPKALDQVQEAGDREYAMSYLERTTSRLREVGGRYAPR